MLGHADLGTTELYTHVSERRRRDTYFQRAPARAAGRDDLAQGARPHVVDPAADGHARRCTATRSRFATLARTRSSRSGNGWKSTARASAPVSSASFARRSSFVNVNIPQSVWAIRNSSVPSSQWEMTSERIASS